MRNSSPQRWHISELFGPLFVFLILICYTYGILFVAPYPGFNFSNTSGRVVGIYSQLEQTSSLQKDDLLKQIGPISWKNYKRDSRLILFEGLQPGDVVDITIERNGTIMTIPWKFTGFDSAEFKTRFFNIWGLAFIFWFFGTAAQLSIRPKDERRMLFIAANYLMALWLIFGSLSSQHLWGSSILLHCVTWLLMPVYLHLHWVFPRPLKELPKTVWGLFYLIGFVFALAEVTQSLPKGLYAFIFLFTLIGSILLQAVHFLRYKEQRRDVSFIIASILVAFIPSIGLGFLVAIGVDLALGPISLFSLPFMSIAYFYIIYRRQLGGLEIRVNRFISLYAFLVLFGTALLIFVIPIASLKVNPEKWIFLIILSTLLTAFSAIMLFPRFQVFVEERFLGIKLPYQNLLETYSSRITTSTSLTSLLQLLDEEIFPSLLIRQFAFLQASNESLKALLLKNVSADELPGEDRGNDLVARSGKYIPIFSSADEWIRLILPLKVGEEVLGFWLLGRRDPDDLYSQTEISILQTLANQTAIALSNILQTVRLKATYREDINEYENELTHLSLKLHDDILYQLATLKASIEDEKISPSFLDAYKKLTSQLREIITELHPPMLSDGLALAIQGLADNLMERSRDTINIIVDIETDDTRYQVNNLETHIFRIVREACENTLHHARAKNIQISGRLYADEISLTITDDGIGLNLANGVEVDSLQKHKHFGLAGILKRAELINARVTFFSAPQKGTTVQIVLKQNPLIMEV